VREDWSVRGRRLGSGKDTKGHSAARLLSLTCEPLSSFENKAKDVFEVLRRKNVLFSRLRT
jgi:hypothetical protein